MTPFDRWLRWFLDSLLKRKRPMPQIDLSDATKALLATAFEKKAAATDADAADAAAADALALAAKAKDDTAADRLQKHADATAAAHDFIAAAAAEVGFALPG